MGQFKPMVKMETTEPSVILKLKKGGHVNMKKGGKAEAGHKKMADGGGAMAALAGTPALLGRPAVNAPVQAPGKPSMAARRAAMMAKKPAMGTPSGPAMPAGNPGLPGMKKGGKATGGKMEHDDAAQDRAMIKKAMAGKKFASGGAIPSETSSGSYDTTKVYTAKADKANGTGGVKNGNAGGFKRGGKAKGYASGGAIPSEESYGDYDTTKVYQAKPDSASGTGGVRLGNAGGFKRGGSTKRMATGGVTESNGGGYRKGGAAKKFADGGKVQNDGGPEKMPQGRKPVPQPVEINMLAGSYKRGGKVAPGNKALQASFEKTNAPAMREAKAKSVESYAPMGSTVRGKRMADGGSTSGQGPITKQERKTMDDLSRGAYDKAGQYSRELEDAMNPLSMAKELYGKARNAFSGQGPITDKERSILSGVTKKRGGMAC